MPKDALRTMPDLVKKLHLHAGQKALLMNAPQGYPAQLGELPLGATLSTSPEGTFDFVLAFAHNRAELDRLAPLAKAAVVYDGMLWLCYPKLGSRLEADLSRDIIWKALAPLGLQPVTQIAVDDTWSALRFRPIERVGQQR
jgi:hypothetical protein